MSGPEDTTRLLIEIRDLLRDIATTQKADADLRSRLLRRWQRTALLLLLVLGLYLLYSVWWYARARRS